MMPESELMSLQHSCANEKENWRIFSNNKQNAVENGEESKDQNKVFVLNIQKTPRRRI
jgi:hypothetical protein